MKKRAVKMAQRVKVLAAKPEGLDLIPGTYLVEGGNGPQRIVLMSAVADMRSHVR